MIKIINKIDFSSFIDPIIWSINTSNFSNTLVIINKKLLNFGKSVSRTLKVQPDGHGN